MKARIPSEVTAVFAALQFQKRAAWIAEPDTDWQAALAFCDRAQLTLAFGDAAGDALPEWVRERIARNVADNARLLERIRALELQAGGWLQQAGLEFIILKGTTHWPDFVSVPDLRPQGDLDLFCPPQHARQAWELLRGKGYATLEDPGAHAVDHWPTLVLKNGWEWDGNPYDPTLPIDIEVHYQFWDERTEGFRAEGVEQFWTRRNGLRLDLTDALAYASLHLLRHLLRGSVRAHHVYEIAWFLQHHADDRDFWNRWRELHAPSLRRLQAVIFRLAHEWFGCNLGPAAEEEVAALPQAVQEWFATFAFSPLEAPFHPNKNELWLHLALVENVRGKFAVVRRRLLPLQLPGPVDANSLPDDQLTFSRRARSKLRYARYVGERFAFHVRATVSLVSGGSRWWMRSSGLSEGYWRFLGASSLFVLGMFIYSQLYTLYLLDLGFHEDFIGKISSASTAGTVSAILPAAALSRRWGLGKLLLVFFAALTVVSAARVLVSNPAALLAFSFANGVVFALYAVLLAPAIARLTSDQARSIGFSISTASSIALGVIGGWLWGSLPRLMGGKRPVLLLGCALVAAALWPAAGIHLAPAPAEDAKFYPRSRFVVHFLIVFAIWNLATGAFNPFFATYFAHLHTPVERMGLIYSASQLTQVAALMLAPLVLRRLGIVGGTAAMLLATAFMLGGLASGPTGLTAAAVFCLFTATQWMTDPGINTLLMDRVRDQERSGAAALMMLVSFAGQLAASWIGGNSIARYGYPVVLSCSAGLAAIAALGFRLLPNGSAPLIAEPRPAFVEASAPENPPD